MRKFKHNKTGHIFEQDGSYYNRPKHEHIPAWLVEDSNDWEEIIEKDYEILSLKYNDYIYAFIKNNKYFKTKDCSGGYVYLKDILTEDIKYRASIHSVRRISDGEIFTIGDNITYNNEKTIIEGFNLQFNKYLIADFKKTVSNCIGCNINYIQKAKQPLFTTEDGVDIFEGDDNTDGKGKRLYQVSLCESEDSWNDPIKPWDLCILNAHKYRGNGKDFLVFSTKEKAQEYIDLHKPKYSINDLNNASKIVNTQIFKGYVSIEMILFNLGIELKKLNK